MKDQILSHSVVKGAMLFEFFSPGISQILVNTNAKFVIYDMEHTGLDFSHLKWLLASCRGLPIKPMVRVPRGDYPYLARALDLGAIGVMVPMVETLKQAREIASSCRYPPDGRRGSAFGFAQCNYESGEAKKKIQHYNSRTVIIAQIETELGLDNIEAIASVAEIDVLWVGHHDLANFLKIPGDFENPKFLRAIEKISKVARKNGKAAGIMTGNKLWTKRAIEIGYTMIAVGPETTILQDGLKNILGSAD